MTEIPNILKTDGLYCCWRYEERNGKTSKVPYQPTTGYGAKSNDISSFTSFDVAIGASGYDGIGIGIFNGVCAIDLDHCVSDIGKLTATAAEIIAAMHSYTEYSPSGEGIHILFHANDFQYDTKRFYIMNRSKNIEVYVAGATNKYVTLTGNRMNDYEYGERSKELQLVLEKFMSRSKSNYENEVHAVNAINAAYSLNEEDILQKALNGKNGQAFSRLWNGNIQGYSSHSEADMALCCNLAFWTGKDSVKMDQMFRESGLMRDKWNRVQSGTTYGAITIQRAIENCNEVYTPRKINTKKEPRKELPQQNPVQQETQFQPLVPLKPQSMDLPLFPVDCLPEVLRNYVTAVAAHSQTAPDMSAVIGLGVLAVCLQGKYQVEGVPGYTEPLSLYTVVVAAPGERKSSVMRDMTGFIYEYEKEFNAAREPAIRANKQERESLERQIVGLQKILERKADRMTELELQQLQNELGELPEIKPVRFFADDCSSEALTSLLATSEGRFAVISTEGGIFDIMAGRYSSKVNIDVWLKGHCGDAIRVDRLGREAEYIPHPALSAILSIQPSVLDEIMANATMTGRGLIARFLYATPPSRIGKRVFITPPITPEVSEAYRNMVFQLMDLPSEVEPITIRLSRKATEVMESHFIKHEQFLTGEGQEISDWANKYIGTVLRISGLLHASQCDAKQQEISSKTVEDAIQIGQYFLAHTRYAYSVMGTDLSIQKARFVLAKLMKTKVIKRSELFQICRGKFFKKTDELFPTLELLEERGYIRLEQPVQQSAGRPPDVKVLLNPLAVVA